MKSLSYLEKWVTEKGLPKYRAKQIYQALTKNLISNWDEAIELPKDWHDVLNKELPISTLKIKNILPDNSGRGVIYDAPTVKITFQTHDDLVIESVLMHHTGDRNTVCVSTQIGCSMDCRFCATGKMGFKRNLTAEEIVDQVLEFARLLKAISYKPKANHVTNVVFMGMGEPFLNYENVIEAIKILNDKDGFNLGHRHMTISTSGFVPEILRFADEKIQVNLAISLHAPNNQIRGSIMPVNKKYPLEKLLPAVSTYMNKTVRKIFFEYVLLKGVNDSDKNIKELIMLLKKYFVDQMQLVHINLIGFNLIEETGATQGLCIPNFEPTSKERTKKIFDLLQKSGILATVRYHFGGDIRAACGQLAGKA